LGRAGGKRSFEHGLGIFTRFFIQRLSNLFKNILKAATEDTVRSEMGDTDIAAS
jgi:hypothetical protein